MNAVGRAKQLAMRGMVRALLLRERLESGAAWNPLDPQYYSNPYPLYRRLREKDPVHRSRLQDAVVFTRHADIVELLRDPRLSADDRNQAGYGDYRRKGIEAGALDEHAEDDVPSMLRMDPPDHTRLRSLVNKAFTPRAVQALRPRIEEIVVDHLDAAAERGEMDIVRDLGVPLPIIVIAEMLGIPPGDHEQFKHWSDGVVRGINVRTYDDLRTADEAGKELQAYLEPIAEERRASPREDLLSGLLAAEDAGDTLSMPEVFATVVLLLVAGNETTTNLIGNGTLALMRHRDQWRRLCDDPGLVESAVEELLRYDSPVQGTTRIPLEDMEFRGQRLNRGSEVFLLFGAANRDPDQFPDPDRLDIGRQENRHLAFGQGIHYCLGAPLARLEAQVAFTHLAQRFPHLRLKPAKLEWADNLILHGLTSLPVALGK